MKPMASPRYNSFAEWILAILAIVMFVITMIYGA